MHNLKCRLDIGKRMDLKELKADIMALRKLYGLLEVNEYGFQNAALQNLLDERSWLLLRNLLDGAAQKLFEQFIKCDEASVSLTPSTPKPNPTHGPTTPLHSCTEAIHSTQNAKTRRDSMNNARSKLTQNGITHRSTLQKPENHTLQKNQRRMKEISISQEKTPRKENSTLNHRGRKSPFYPEYIPTNPVSSSYESDEGSRTSPFSPTSVSSISCGSAEEEESITNNSESYSESIDSFSRSRRRRRRRRSYGLSGDGRNGNVWGRKSGSRRSSYHTYSRFLKKPFGRLRKLRNKLALVFHHHHHHHHHHGSVEGGSVRRKQKSEGKEVVRVEERKKGKRKGGKKKGNFGTLVEGLKQHVRNSKKKKKKLKHPKMEKGNGSCRELKWWKMFHKRRGRALEKRTRHGLLEEKYENASF